MNMPGGSRKNSGFTLLEVLIVLLIFALVMTVVYPSLSRVFDVQFKSSTRILAGTVQYAFNQAAMQKNYVRLHYNIDTNEYWITTLTETGEFLEDPLSIIGRTQLPVGVRFEDVVTLHAGKIDEGETTTMFLPTGMAEPSVIHIASESGEVFTLIVKPLSGRCEILEGYIDLEGMEQTP
ncbi:MAG: prepilin-type N-terminal cleavage/methylation domain-containing protein [Candidatus Alcyoniella australis]|nr:prepilin-type N-terminal cleavage/methylation domain-containing protein [Candidatus Alcyoniella australis]